MYYVQVELEYPSKNVRSTIFFVTICSGISLPLVVEYINLRFLLFTAAAITWHYSSSSSIGTNSSQKA